MAIDTENLGVLASIDENNLSRLNADLHISVEQLTSSLQTLESLPLEETMDAEQYKKYLDALALCKGSPDWHGDWPNIQEDDTFDINILPRVAAERNESEALEWIKRSQPRNRNGLKESAIEKAYERLPAYLRYGFGYKSEQRQEAIIEIIDTDLANHGVTGELGVEFLMPSTQEHIKLYLEKMFDKDLWDIDNKYTYNNYDPWLVPGAIKTHESWIQAMETAVELFDNPDLQRKASDSLQELREAIRNKLDLYPELRTTTSRVMTRNGNDHPVFVPPFMEVEIARYGFTSLMPERVGPRTETQDEEFMDARILCQ